MLYCSFEPGLFILQGIAPHETSKAFAVVRSLILHKKMMDQANVQIPMTNEYAERVYAAVEAIPISNPPLASELRKYIYAALAKMSSPLLHPSGLARTVLEPDFASDWIDDETKSIWLDSLTSAMFDEYVGNDIKLSAATWYRESVPTITYATNPNLCEQLDISEHRWSLPVLADELGWEELLCLMRGWPVGLDSILIDAYAKKYLGVSDEQLRNRRKIQFESPCIRAISRENDESIRMSIVEIIACRAFNSLRPEQNDETLERQPGIRRVYVKKMTPPVRLHYFMDDETVTYILYSNNDHDRGL